ncbi:MAG: cytochrome c biogenesis protein ResB [Candidatus Aminicenantes bacterium]|nr:cytochrome c biogenesis protein ResB [Candidatus Aminicenantes bacterium]
MTQANNSAANNKNKMIGLLKKIASLKLTVVCLVLFAFLVVWGTIYQADHGLYQAQQKFFFSWFFLIFGFIPFPGTVLVMFVMFFNLLGSLFFRIKFKLSNIGNIITHTGIMVLLLGGFLTFYFSVESTLMLREGETGNMSSSHRSWELAVWEKGGRDIYAVDSAGLNSGDTIDLTELGLVLQVNEYYDNCTSYTGTSAAPGNVINASGIRALEEKPRAVEAGENIAGLIFQAPSAAAGQAVLLYGNDSMATPAAVNKRTFFFSLRRKKFLLPLNMTLLDFKVKLYPNSNIPKSYASRVKIKAAGGIEREVIISMNKPLRFADLTFFQSSYQVARDGTEYTILAVVKNSGRLLPYISSIWIFLGLIVHFLVKLRKRRNMN